MTIVLSTIRSGLGDWFASTTGLVGRDRDGPQYWGGTWNTSSFTAAPVNAHGLMHIKVLRTVGRDQIEWVEDTGADAGEEMVPYTFGGRELLWECGVKSLSQAAGSDATHFLQKVMDSFTFPTSKATFKNLQLGVQSISPIREIPIVEADRANSHALIEVVFNATVYYAGSPTTYVEYYEISSQLEDSGGTLLPSKQQMVEELIGE